MFWSAFEIDTNHSSVQHRFRPGGIPPCGTTLYGAYSSFILNAMTEARRGNLAERPQSGKIAIGPSEAGYMYIGK